MRGSRAVSGVFLLLVLVLFLVNTNPAWAPSLSSPSLIITPNPVQQDASVQISGTGFLPNQPGILVVVFADSSCFGLDVLFQFTSTDGSGNLAPVTFSTSSLAVGTHCVISAGQTGTVYGSLLVTGVPWSICVVQVGLVQQDGSTAWIGTGVTGAPITDCQNKTEYFTDVIGDTVAFHQFILNGTSSHPVTLPF
jgi:hypothetical protein